MRQTFLAALTAATALGAALPAAHAAVASEGPDRQCAGTTKIADSYGRKANVNSCVASDGQFVQVSAPADCFYAYGTSRYEKCWTRGTWKMFRGQEQVASGYLGSGNAPYPGPGTYRVVAEVNANGGTASGSSGFSLHGTTTKTFTLTAPKKEMPFTVGVTPDRRDSNSETDFTFTVTSSGASEGGATLIFTGPAMTPHDNNGKCRVMPGSQFFGPRQVHCFAKKGEVTKLHFTARKAPHQCEPIQWNLRWNLPDEKNIRGTIPCA